MDEKTLGFALEVTNTNTVTITNEEYADLQRRSAALDFIFAMNANEPSYSKLDYINTMQGVISPVITAEEAAAEDDEDAE